MYYLEKVYYYLQCTCLKKTVLLSGTLFCGQFLLSGCANVESILEDAQVLKHYFFLTAKASHHPIMNTKALASLNLDNLDKINFLGQSTLYLILFSP